MSSTVTVQQAAANLPQLIDSLKPDDEIIVTDGERPIAKIVSTQRPVSSRQPGSARGTLTVVADDDEHLADFKDYMP